MNVQINSAISVDCVIFGFDGAAIKVLLVRRRTVDPGLAEGTHVTCRSGKSELFEKLLSEYSEIDSPVAPDVTSF